MPNAGYVFQTSPDLNKWSFTFLTVSVAGVMEMTVPLAEGETKMFYRFAYGVAGE